MFAQWWLDKFAFNTKRKHERETFILYELMYFLINCLIIVNLLLKLHIMTTELTIPFFSSKCLVEQQTPHKNKLKINCFLSGTFETFEQVRLGYIGY